MKRYTLIIITILALALLSCSSWTTGTFSLFYIISENPEPSSEALQVRIVDLNEESDYEEHRDEITGIDRIMIAANIENSGAYPITAQIFLDTISTWTTVAEVEANATLVYDPDFEIAAGETRLITMADGLDYMENTDFMEDLVLNVGTFTSYVVVEGQDPFEVSVFAGVLIIFTVGL
jgi:hypothetical protein